MEHPYEEILLFGIGKELYISLPAMMANHCKAGGIVCIAGFFLYDLGKAPGMYVMLTFLEVNGIKLECSNEDIVEAGLGVASGAMDYEGLLTWVRNH